MFTKNLQETSAEEVTKFLGDMNASGIRIWVGEGGLQFRAPAGVMTESIRAAIAQRKRAILAVLVGPKFHARAVPSWIPILRHHHSYWKQLQSGAFDIGFINGSYFVIKGRGPLDLQLLKERVAWLAARHSILRARVIENEEVGFAFDQPHESLLKILDLSCDSGSSTLIQAVADDLVWSAFDCSTGPMARIFAVRLNASEYLLGMVVHHFICDGMSLQLLAKELLCGPAANETPVLQYSDYIHAMNEWIDGGGLQPRMEYWKEQLRNAPATRLPPDFSCDPDARTQLNVEPFSVPAKVIEALNVIAQRRQTTLFSIVLAAKMSVLAWFGGNADVVVLIQHHQRDNVNLLGVVGAMTDRLPIRAQIAIHSSFEENLTRVQDALKAAYTYAVPYSVLENILPDIGASAIAPSMNFLNFAIEAPQNVASHGIERFAVTPPAKHGTSRKHAAHWMTYGNSSGIHGSVGYSSALYRQETFALFLATFCGVLEGVAADPEQTVVQLCNKG